ncbi:MAG: glycosyltransferase [Candidatus Dormibacteraeota bacterium]|nr:glycosyltransferase [Candidatus Dormibacteraeota bacterium]
MDRPEGSGLREVPAPPPARAVTMLTLVHGWPDDVERWLGGVTAATAPDWEALLVVNTDTPDVAKRVTALAAERVRVLAEAPPTGWAEAANAGLEAAAGAVTVLFDPGVEVTGDVAGPLLAALADPEVVVAGAFGVRAAGSVGHFHTHPGPDVDALEGYVLAVRTAEALAAGGFDRRFRFYRLADFELCLRLRAHSGGRAVVVPKLPVEKHEHRLWEALDETERERLSRRNFYRLRDLWGARSDLLLGGSGGQ